MPTAETLLRMILGPVRSDIRPLALAVDITGGLLFEQNYAMDDIKVTKDIYPQVAQCLNQKIGAVTKSIERLTCLCWDSLKRQDLISVYLGRPEKQTPTPRELLIYLAVYSHLGISFFDLVEKEPRFLFQTPDNPAPLTVPVCFIAQAILRNMSVPVTQVMEFQFSSGGTTFPVCPFCGITLEREYQNFATGAGSD